MKLKGITRFVTVFIVAWFTALSPAEPALYAHAHAHVKKILLLVEGDYDAMDKVSSRGRMIAALLGHFNVVTTIKGVNAYKSHDVDRYDFTFYIGYNSVNKAPLRFLRDVLASHSTIVWCDTGMLEFCKNPKAAARYGFSVTKIVQEPLFDVVSSGIGKFTRREEHINLITIGNGARARVIATAESSATKESVPYIIHAKNLYYIADTPVSMVSETDRYILFAELLHDILNEHHKERHSALIRIEDVNPLSDPARLRTIADILSKRSIPFLVSVVPVYVNPSSKDTAPVTLSNMPKVAEALHYMVRHGGSIVMHGVTHQYKGKSTDDFEFWDKTSNAPIKEENANDIDKKIDSGIDEFLKNGLYPLIWETPHYAASPLTYKIIAGHFSTAVEQRLASNRFEYGQFFPYVIYKDLYGQKILPENLGYVPFDSDKSVGMKHVAHLIDTAKLNLAVRDGFASCFFHPFLDPSLLEELVDGIKGLGYEYIDVAESSNWVKNKDVVILSGNRPIPVKAKKSIFRRSGAADRGDLPKTASSSRIIHGKAVKYIHLGKGNADDASR